MLYLSMVKLFKDFLKEKRIKLGLTQDAMAKFLGISRECYRARERNKNNYLTDTSIIFFQEKCPSWGDDSLWNIWRKPPAEYTKKCKHPSCNSKQAAREYCGRHYREFLLYGRIRDLSERKAENGVGHLDRHGYIRHHLGPGNIQIFQHRKVMEEFLGRKLTDQETVHHINGIRHDNRLENLELWSKSHPAGQRVKDKIQWAKEFLKEYGYKITKT